jgi:DUF1009 family protein
MEELQSPIGLIAGNGSYPIECARHAKSRGLDVVAVAHIGETSKELESFTTHCCWVKVGELGKIIDTFVSRGVRQVAFAGGITRVKLFGGVKLDARALGLIARVGSVKDDAILRGVASELERSGLTVISASALLQGATLGVGCLTKRRLRESERQDALIGWEAAKIVGSIDIGQTVVVNQGVVVAVEAVEGTDAAIRRAGTLSGKGATVVKRCKPGQDVRIDLPTIGRGTIESMVAAGASALVLEAHRSVVLEPDIVAGLANKADICIELIVSAESLGVASEFPGK